jgi:hypothetical protein
MSPHHCHGRCVLWPQINFSSRPKTRIKGEDSQEDGKTGRRNGSKTSLFSTSRLRVFLCSRSLSSFWDEHQFNVCTTQGQGEPPGCT